MTTQKTKKAGTVTCSKNHSGNKTLHKMGRGRLAIYRECAGCGAIYTLDQLATL
jgi:hypothetical protein